jgi:4-amino-4-deoxy-L-arabinose transferase-like glycosyltransferase
MKKFWIVVLLLLVSLSVRLYQITNHTEFLGDQGRDALVMSEFVREGKWPVVGPTVGAGHYTGPFYYYLIVPSFVLFEFNPVAAAVEMVMISIAAILLFLSLATSLFGFSIAYGVSMLWALSPLMIMQDRRLWNPTPIPFFVLLLIASLWWIFKQKKYWAFLSAAFAAVALIQLHYVNGISLFLTGLLAIGVVYKEVKQRRGKKIIPWLIGGIGLFVLLLYPFISYEAKRGFTDITGSVMTLVLKEGQVFSKRLYVNTFIDIGSRLASYIVALPWKTPLIIISACLLVGNLIKRKTVSYILVAWFCIGIACLSLYKDTVQPQYAYQFIPIVFLLLAGSIQGVRKLRWPLILGLVLVMTGSSWFFSNPYKTTDPDIPRVNALTDAVIAIAKGRAFAFTVMNSRSFTDFHVRYFFRMKSGEVVPVEDVDNKTLFIVCEAECPKVELMNKVSVMCHTDLCPLDKPEIPLQDWTYVSTSQVGSSAVYTYKR